MAPRTGRPFSGTKRKLVLGIDLGTTYAGISFSLLEPGKIPTILPVTRFPPQEQVGGDSKVRSIVYYDWAGQARALGAAALQESVQEKAEEEGWRKAEWFKLHMRPDSITVSSSLPPLPRTKTALDVFADFLRYLYNCAQTYIVDNSANGGALWITLEDTIEFVLTHPNGWEGEQQSKMRQAAVIAGLIPNNANGQKRIHFVTEGEASLHFCIMNGLATDPLKQGKGVIIVDAGGGTVDISAYRKVSRLKGDSFEEIVRSACLLEGSIFVTRRAKDHLTATLRNSKYTGDVDHIAECFDTTTKLKFLNTDEWSYIKFGRPRDRDDEFNIINGQMKLPGTIVGSFFKPSIDAIVNSVWRMLQASPVAISSVLLVGGFAASEWLTSELKRRLGGIGLDVSRPDSHVNKAVSDGAVSFYLNRYVSARISKEHYGIKSRTPYESNNADHRARSKSAVENLEGNWMLPNCFSIILPKDARVSETKEFRQEYTLLETTRAALSRGNLDILRYRGDEKNPQWIDDDPHNYSTLCTVSADTSGIAKTLKPRLNRQGTTFYTLKFSVVLSFGLTELKAEIAWTDEKVCRSLRTCRGIISHIFAGAGEKVGFKTMQRNFALTKIQRSG
ncbi:hypothetical protein C8F01DRAFT_1129822 [Mycena amicta]|nr:hypothetical protein C8F01DRAFT_1129822 [Mycena amicta]